MLTRYVRATRLVIAIAWVLPGLIWASNIVLAGQHRLDLEGARPLTSIVGLFLDGLAPQGESYALWAKLAWVLPCGAAAVLVFRFPERLLGSMDLNRAPMNDRRARGGPAREPVA